MEEHEAITSWETIHSGLSPVFLLVLLILPFLFTVLKLIKHSTSAQGRQKPLPPGPRPWPLIGNLLHFGTKPYVSLTQLARVHGPLISLRLGSQILVVGSSPLAAEEILKTGDRVLSGRYLPQSFPARDLDEASIMWSTECVGHWKLLRTLCRTELFSARAVQAQAALREKKVAEMLEFIGAKEGRVVNVGKVVFETVLDTLCVLFFSKEFQCLGDDNESTRKVSSFSALKGLFHEMSEMAIAPNLADVFPVLARWDLQGLKRKCLEIQKRTYVVWEEIIRERRYQHSIHINGSPKHGDFLDIMLENKFSDRQINTLIIEFLIAGTDSSTTTIEWAMAELLKNKEVMKKVQQEVRREIQLGSVTESDLSKLPYLDACVKETFRLHPPVPFLIPHRATETCEVMNYRIPKDSLVIVNTLAIGCDPAVWEDPLSFKPDRFLNNSEVQLDFKGQDFVLLPFGAGRRMCPGLPLAIKQVHLILAALIRSFDWCLPNNEDPSQLDMAEKFVVTLQRKEPLLLVAKQN